METPKSTVQTETIELQKGIITVETWLPIFPGFYNTIFEFPDDIEYSLYDDPKAIDKTVRDFVMSIIWEFIDYAAYQNDITKAATDYIEERCFQCLPGIVIAIRFQTVKSPREYNFTNDSVNIEIDIDFAALLRKFAKHPQSGDYLKARYTSCSGFISHYPNSLNEWCKDAFDDRTHTVGSMLEFFLRLYILECGESAEFDMYQYVSECDTYAGQYIKTDKILECVNEEFTYNPDIKKWSDIDNFIGIVGGSRFDQLVAGIGLFETAPENIPETEFHDSFGLYNTMPHKII